MFPCRACPCSLPTPSLNDIMASNPLYKMSNNLSLKLMSKLAVVYGMLQDVVAHAPFPLSSTHSSSSWRTTIDKLQWFAMHTREMQKMMGTCMVMNALVCRVNGPERGHLHLHLGLQSACACIAGAMLLMNCASLM